MFGTVAEGLGRLASVWGGRGRVARAPLRRGRHVSVDAARRAETRPPVGSTLRRAPMGPRRAPAPGASARSGYGLRTCRVSYARVSGGPARSATSSAYAPRVARPRQRRACPLGLRASHTHRVSHARQWRGVSGMRKLPRPSTSNPAPASQEVPVKWFQARTPSQGGPDQGAPCHAQAGILCADMYVVTTARTPAAAIRRCDHWPHHCRHRPRCSPGGCVFGPRKACPPRQGLPWRAAFSADHPRRPCGERARASGHPPSEDCARAR